MMSIAQTYLEYAKAFEDTYEDNHWTRVEPYFAADAEYLPGDGRTIQGREAISSHFNESVDGLDRRFDSRILEHFGEPSVNGNQTSIPWELTLKKDGAPNLVLKGTGNATFEGNLISRLEDVFDDGVVASLQEWMGKHAQMLA
jgi:hypothetical protein